MNDLSGQSLGRYHLIEKLGEGGMAVVYKAYDTHLECDVAVKIIRTDQLAPVVLEKALKRFEREAKSVAKLTHPNIVKVIDYGEFEGKPYLVMPYLPGGTLKQLIKERGQIPWQEAVQILLPIAEALDYAHSQGIIHRDVKPSNILLTQSGQPMLTDFGVAKIIDEENTLDLTGTSATVGTPEYMAPEQVTSKTVDHRADIYSLGVVFYEMITGRRPYEADTPMAVLFKHASDPLPRPSLFLKGLPDHVEKVLIKALAKMPEDRYQSMSEFEKALLELNFRSNISNQSKLHSIESSGVVSLLNSVKEEKNIPLREKDRWNKKWAIISLIIVILISFSIFINIFITKGNQSTQQETSKTFTPSAFLSQITKTITIPSVFPNSTSTPTSFSMEIIIPKFTPTSTLLETEKSIPFANITVDGNNEDWSNIPYLITDSKNDSLNNLPGMDFDGFSLAQNENYFYLLFDIVGKYSGSKEKEIDFRLYKYGGESCNQNIVQFSAPINSSVVYIYNDNENYKSLSSPVNNSLTVWDNCLEIRVPKSVFYPCEKISLSWSSLNSNYFGQWESMDYMP